jgi:hypothetical protein
MLLTLNAAWLESMPEARFTGWYFVTTEKEDQAADDPVSLEWSRQ